MTRGTIARTWPWKRRRHELDVESYEGLIHIDSPTVLLKILCVRQALGLELLLNVPPLLQPPRRRDVHELSGVDVAGAAQQCQAQWDTFMESRVRSSDGFEDPGSDVRSPFDARVEAAVLPDVNRLRADTLGQLRRDGPRSSWQLAWRLGELFGDVPEQDLRLDLLPLASDFEGHVSGSQYYVHDLAGFLQHTEGT